MANAIEDLDDIDKKIITLLQEEGDISFTEIGKRLNKSQPAIGARVLKLNRQGILGTQKGVNFKRSGLPLMLVRVKTNEPERLIKRAEICPFIINALNILGEDNFELIMTATSIEALNERIDNCYRKDHSIQSINTGLVVSLQKDLVLPIDFKIQQYEGDNCPYNCPFNPKELPIDIQHSTPVLEKILANEKNKIYFDKMLYSLKKIIDVEGIGIRLNDHFGKTRFYVWKGFSDEFYLSEGVVGLDECLCGFVARGDKRGMGKFTTDYGSIITNDFNRTVKEIFEKYKVKIEKFRGKCLQDGNKSLALIPLKSEDNVFGVLYLSDKRGGIFTDEKIEILESFAQMLANYLASFINTSENHDDI